MQIHQFSYSDDNYGVLLRCSDTGEVAAIDAGDASAYLLAAEQQGWRISQIWITHHHADHIAGLHELVSQTGAQILGPESVTKNIEGAKTLAHHDKFTIADHQVGVIATPGHTLDMLNFYLPSENLLFSGDTLFTLGCGRLFEGDAQMMWDSMCKLMLLPDDTIIYSGHEYGVGNAEFAMTIDPDNAELQARQAQILSARAAGEPSVPSELGLERRTNPFLRAADPAIRARLGMVDAADADVFAEIRKRKNQF